ncbi:MAG: ABC transporter substrate-binding protein [Anaerocolumna sp.]
MIKKSKIFMTAIVASMLLLTGCKEKDSTLTVGIMPDLDSIPMVVAEHLGYFDDNIKLEIYKSPVDRDSALYSGNLDGSISDVLAAGLANEGDFPVYITSKTYGRYGIVASKDSLVTNPKELEGKEIGLSLNTIIEYVADMAITTEGGDPALVTKTSVPKIPSRLELMNNNQITAIAVPEPYLSAAVDAGGVLIASSDDLGINPGIMIFTKSAVEDKEKELKAFYEAYDKAVDYINNTDPSEFMPYVIEKVGLPESTIQIQLPTYEKTTLPEEEEVEQAMNWLVDKELIKNLYTYDELIYKINK